MGKMRYAVMTFMFAPWWKDGRITHEALIEELAREGVQGIEPFHPLFAEEPGLIARYARALDATGLGVAAVDVICDLVYSSPQEKARGREELARGLDVCVALGARVALVAGHMPKKGVTLEDARKMISEGLSERADFAKARGITLAIEDFGLTPELMCKAADCLKVMGRADGRIRFVFDTGNFEFAGERADESFDALWERICHVHFKDWRPVEDRRAGDGGILEHLCGCPLGEGIVPNAEIARRLLEKGYDGWVSLEATAVAETPAATVRRDLAVLRGWF
ncbi:MAG: sugar phosphate isomerase/epimerase family protein [Planctomycetota bacterium]